MDANLIKHADGIISSLDKKKKYIVVKKDRGLLERKIDQEEIFISEDNRQILLG